MACRLKLLPIILALLVAPFASAQDSRSPFLPPATGDARVVEETPDAPLQFCGYVGQGQNARYCLYDPAKRRSMWLPVGGEEGSVELQSVDRESGTVTVAQSGRVMTLKLQTAKVSGKAGAGGPLPIASTGGAAPAAASPPNVTAADEARRLEAVAAEVRRRRALRQAAAQEQQRSGGEGQRPQGRTGDGDQRERTPAAEPGSR